MCEKGNSSERVDFQIVSCSGLSFHEVDDFALEFEASYV